MRCFFGFSLFDHFVHLLSESANEIETWSEKNSENDKTQIDGKRIENRFGCLNLIRHQWLSGDFVVTCESISVDVNNRIDLTTRSKSLHVQGWLRNIPLAKIYSTPSLSWDFAVSSTKCNHVERLKNEIIARGNKNVARSEFNLIKSFPYLLTHTHSVVEVKAVGCGEFFTHCHNLFPNWNNRYQMECE